jgi:hypothetical protein
MSWLDRFRGREQSTEGTAEDSSPAQEDAAAAQGRAERAAAMEASRRDIQARHDDGKARGDASARASDVRGRPYVLWPDTVRELKREKRHDEALELLYECIGAAERDARGREPAPWYTENAAIIHRQRGEHDAEVAVLEHWIAATPPARRYGRISERLEKARALRDRHRANG